MSFDLNLVLNEQIAQQHGHKIRARVCGLLFEGDSVLLVKHLGLGPEGVFWAPPGGGMEFGDSAEDNLIREFKEETALDIEVIAPLFTFEYLSPPLHSIELFFSVKKIGGKLAKGYDPEYDSSSQIIEEVKFVTFDDLGIIPIKSLHHMLTLCPNPQDLLKMRGYFKFEK